MLKQRILTAIALLLVFSGAIFFFGEKGTNLLFSLGLFVALRELFALTIKPEKTLGTAFGILTVVQNIGSTVAPYAVGYLNDNTVAQQGYFWSEIFFIGVSILTFLCDIVLWYYDN